MSSKGKGSLKNSSKQPTKNSTSKNSTMKNNASKNETHQLEGHTYEKSPKLAVAKRVFKAVLARISPQKERTLITVKAPSSKKKS